MQSMKEAAAAFLANKRVAVTGVSRTPGTHGSNNVYRRLRERGDQVFAVNPNTGQVEGDRCYPDLVLAACLSAHRTMINGNSPCAALAVTERD